MRSFVNNTIVAFEDVNFFFGTFFCKKSEQFMHTIRFVAPQIVVLQNVDMLQSSTVPPICEHIQLTKLQSYDMPSPPALSYINVPSKCNPQQCRVCASFNSVRHSRYIFLY